MFTLVLKMFILWKADLPKILLKEKKEKYLQQSFYKKKMLRAWLKCLEKRKEEQKNLIKSEVIYKIILSKRCFQKLHTYKKWRQRLRLYGKCIYEKNRENTLFYSLKQWRIGFKINRNQRILEKEKNFELIRNYFICLKKNFITKKMRKIHLMALDRYLFQKDKRNLFNCLFSWKNFARKRKRSQDVINKNFLYFIKFNFKVLQNYIIRKNIRICKSFFYELIKSCSKELKRNLAKTVAKTSLIEANYKENLEYINMIDEQKIEYNKKTNSLLKDIEEYKEELDEKNKEIVNLEKKISTKFQF